MRRKAALLFAAGLLCGCSSSEVPVTGWPFDPVQFFTGHTVGSATLHLVTGASHRVSVDSHGRRYRAGGLILDQRIDEQGSPPRMRRWVLQPEGAGRWVGTLTDARGPVVVERTNSDVTIRYRMRSGATVEQHLEMPPGNVVQNHLAVSRFGIRLATLDERIRKVE